MLMNILSVQENILRSYGVTILVTVVGTLIGLLLTGTYAYALLLKTYAFRSFFTKGDHSSHAVFRRYDRKLSCYD